MAKRSVQVFVRIRPEAPKSSAFITSRDSYQLKLLTEDSGGFGQKFDATFGSGASQLDLYRACGLPLVEALFEGYDACCFAYGQTGSGKTFTMLGRDGGNDLKLHELDGVIPEVAKDIFRRVSRMEVDAARALRVRGLVQFEVRARYVEVYQGRAFDLLCEAGRTAVAVRERPGGWEREGAGEGAGGTKGELLYALGKSFKVESALGLLALIRRGAANRATASTGQNEHSSRSHALLTVSVEHRWATDSKGRAASGSGAASDGDGAAGVAPTFRSRTARLVLVDLAGSENTAEAHGGTADRSGTSINLGLLALGQVCSALASNASHVPYRDDMLTRLLQPALGGNCRTTMIACVSDDPGKSPETLATLRFGTRVGALRTTSSKASDRAVALARGPMDGDEDDPHPTLRRRAVWIETRNYGDIFAHVCGAPQDPLVLYVHGSGPRNSSLQFNFCQDGLGRRQPGLYQVSIDCPGYGRTPGDRQTIRSFPGPLLKDIVRALGKSKALCLVGSSQGACAVLNAALDQPDLAYFVAVSHPVGHDVARYTRIQQPVLLQFDQEDAGHPISVGRRMRRNLPRNRWFEYATSKSPGWLDENMADNLLDMFRADEYKSVAPRIESDLAAANSDKLPDLTRVAGGVHTWADAHGREFSEYVITLEDEEERAAMAAASKSAGSAASAAEPGAAKRARSVGGGVPIVEEESFEGTEGKEAREATSSGAGAPASTESAVPVWRVRMDPSSSSIEYFCEETGEVSRSRPVGAVVRAEGESAETALTVDELASAPALFRSDSDDEQREAKLQEEAERGREAELGQRVCHRCGGALLLDPAPVRLPACRHLVCGACQEIALKYYRSCPVCGVALRRAIDAAAADDELVAAIKLEAGDVAAARADDDKSAATGAGAAVGASEADSMVSGETGAGAVSDGSFGPAPEAALSSQRARLSAARLEFQSTSRFVLEVGNTSDQVSSGKFTCRTFVRCPVGLRKGSTVSKETSLKHPIKQVHFNINPGYDVPTDRVTKPNGARGEYCLERTLGFTYPCFATVFFKDALKLKPLHVRYYTQVDMPRFAIRIVVQLPTTTPPPPDACTDEAGPDGTLSKPKAGARGRKGRREYASPKGIAAEYEASCGDGIVRYGKGGGRAVVRFMCPAGAARDGAPGKLRPHDDD